jgi:hypothetical protein
VSSLAALILGRDRLPGEALDVAKLIALLGVAERDGDALAASARRSTNAVDIAFCNIGKLKVHYVRHLIDVDAAGGNVGCNQHPDPRCAEGRQRLLPL